MGSKQGLVGGKPLVTCLLAVAMVGAYFALGSTASESARFADETLSEARAFYEQNPHVVVGARDRQLLGVDFVQVVASAHAAAEAEGNAPIYSERMRQRSQERFERLAEEAFAARLLAYPPWRFGVSPQGASASSYLTHVFVHESALALGVTLVFLLFAGFVLESTWGPLLHVGFCALAIAVPGIAFGALNASTGIPFSGGSGLVAALLAAYIVRSVGAAFPFPGWLLLPVWIFVEYIFVRGIWIENVESAPFLTHAAALGVGAGFAVVVRLLGVEVKLVELSDRGNGPELDELLSRAEAAIEQGRAAEILEQIKAAHEATPKELALAAMYWDVARESGQALPAVPAIVPVLLDELRRGISDRATAHWRQIKLIGADPHFNVATLIRMGEALLDEGAPDEAIEVLGQALDHPNGLSTALAQRVIHVARDLDPELTRRAADVALGDASLDPATRSTLEALAAEIRTSRPAAKAPAARPVEAPAPEGAPKTTHETTSYPIDSDIDLDNTAELTDPDEFAELHHGPLPSFSSEELDPNALSIQSLEKEFSGDLGLADEAEAAAASWNDPNVVCDLSDEVADAGPELLSGPAATADAYIDNSHLEAGALSGDALSGESVSEIESDISIALGDELRTLKVIEGIPLVLHADLLEFEVAGRGKSKLELARIEAVAVSAVAGLSAKPVVVIDLVLNWMSASTDALKVIRLHSHTFNPRALVPGAASPLDALKQLLATIVERSGALALPSRQALVGAPFPSHPDLASYQREVLLAE